MTDQEEQAQGREQQYRIHAHGHLEHAHFVHVLEDGTTEPHEHRPPKVHA